jgi:uncharacterized SAM-binding protein YcdF (DUF218 family)
MRNLLSKGKQAIEALQLRSRAAGLWRDRAEPALRACAASRRLRRLVVAGVIAGVGGTGWLYVAIRRSAGVQPKKPADVIIVLGAGYERHVRLPKRVYRARLLYARDLYERGMAPHIIVTERSPAAEIAREYLVELGVPEEAVKLERRSATTWENLSGAHQTMRENEWRTAIIVTCGFHMYRSLKMCEELGIPPQGAATPYAHIEKSGYKRAKYTLRECGTYVAHVLTGK